MTWLVHHASSPKVYCRLQSRVFRISSLSWHLTFITHIIWPNLFLNGFLNTYLPKYLSGLDAFIHPMGPSMFCFHPRMSRTEAASVEASMVSNSRHVSDRRKRAEKGRKISRDENRAVRHRVVGASQGGGFVDVIPGKWFLFFFWLGGWRVPW